MSHIFPSSRVPNQLSLLIQSATDSVTAENTPAKHKHALAMATGGEDCGNRRAETWWMSSRSEKTQCDSTDAKRWSGGDDPGIWSRDVPAGPDSDPRGSFHRMHKVMQLTFSSVCFILTKTVFSCTDPDKRSDSDKGLIQVESNVPRPDSNSSLSRAYGLSL